MLDPDSALWADVAPGVERRREVRYPCDDPAVVQVLSDGTTFPATLLDISRSGLRVRLGVRLSIDAEIQVTLPKQAVILGRVRHCHQLGGQFIAGVETHHVEYPEGLATGHVDSATLDQYIAGKGLAISEVIRVREHLRHCRRCRAHLANPEDTL